MEVNEIYDTKKFLQGSINNEDIQKLIDIIKNNITDVKEIQIDSPNGILINLGNGFDNDIYTNYLIFNDSIKEWLDSMGINVKIEDVFELYDLLILNPYTCILEI